MHIPLPYHGLKLSRVSSLLKSMITRLVAFLPDIDIVSMQSDHQREIQVARIGHCQNPVVTEMGMDKIGPLRFELAYPRSRRHTSHLSGLGKYPFRQG